MFNASNLLVLPRLRVQNANAISSPLTWGFPAMSAFVGLMHALERKLPEEIDLSFERVGVICHDHDVQTSPAGYNTQQFHLTRNPVDKKGQTAAIAEEGRIHLDITLVFAVRGKACAGNDEDRDTVAQSIDDIVRGMRIAGGSVIPNSRPGRRERPLIEPLADSGRDDQFRKLRRRWLPGFALVLRDDMLTQHLDDMRQSTPDTTSIDAWLDFSRLHHDCRLEAKPEADATKREKPIWEIRRRPGWIVPIPVGYGALSDLQPSDTVANARDATTPFRFVESLYSIGQWISPHRLQRPESLLWYVDNELDTGCYRLSNDYQPNPQ